MISSIKKRPINGILIVIIAILYVTNNLYFKKNTNNNLRIFFNGYFNDLICPIAFMSYTNIILLTKNIEIIDIKYIVPIFIIAGIIWEFVAPYFKSNSITDIYDILSYIIGGILYSLILNIHMRKCINERT